MPSGFTFYKNSFFGFLSKKQGAAYCVSNAALSDAVLQKNIDYACGAGADCGQISQNGPCFNPNTVKDHCNFAVNSYYQKKGQVPGSCDFSGTATVSPTPPAGNSACFSGSSSPATPTPGTGTGTPTPGTGTATPLPGTGTGTPTSGTGTATPPPGTGMGTPPPGTGTGTGTPGTRTGTGTGTGTGTPGTGTGTGIGTGTGTGTGTGNGGINVNPPLGLGPSGAGSGFDNSGSISIRQITNLYTLAATLLGCGLIWSRLI